MNPAAETRSRLEADLTTFSRAFRHPALDDSNLTTADPRKRREFKDCTFAAIGLPCCAYRCLHRPGRSSAFRAPLPDSAQGVPRAFPQSGEDLPGLNGYAARDTFIRRSSAARAPPSTLAPSAALFPHKLSCRTHDEVISQGDECPPTPVVH